MVLKSIPFSSSRGSCPANNLAEYPPCQLKFLRLKQLGALAARKPFTQLLEGNQLTLRPLEGHSKATAEALQSAPFPVFRLKKKKPTQMGRL